MDTIAGRFTSLLWPEGKDEFTREQKPSRFVADLGLNKLVDLLNADPRLRHHTENLVYNLCHDPEVINYRLDIIDDLLEHEALVAGLKNLLPLLQDLARYRNERNKKGLHPFQKVAWRLETLSVYVQFVEALHALLDRFASSLKSNGLRWLHADLCELVEGSEFRSLAKDLPGLKASLNAVSSITIGINLDASMRPCEAVFLTVGARPFQPKPLLTRLLGLKSEDESVQGLSAFHSIFKKKPAISAVEDIMFRELNEIFSDAVKHVERVLARYTRENTKILVDLEPAIDFYSSAVALITKLRETGLGVCRPQVAAEQKRVCKLDDLYDLHLALDFMHQGNAAGVVKNDISFSDKARIYMLTGPNQGGKTTFTRAVGTAQVLMQVGMYVPCAFAEISPVDGIYTHFLEEERIDSREGRLGEESRRLSEIFLHATQSSLVLLNESLSSTSPGESLYLAKDVVRAMSWLGCRAIFATHLHDLAACADEINDEEVLSKVGSLVAGLSEEPGRNGEQAERRQRTYRITVGPPKGESFARDIAQQYGISYNQLTARLRERKRKRRQDLHPGVTNLAQ